MLEPLSPPPPLAPGLPVVGNLATYVRDPLAFLQRTARRYGDVVELRFPGMHSYLVSHPDHIEQVLVAQNKNFTKDRFLKDLKRLLGEGLLTSEGDFWRRQRRLEQPAFHRERVNAYAEQMVASARAMVATWRAGEVRDVHADMMGVTLEIVARTLFQADVGDDDAAHVARAVEAVMERYADPIALMFPWFERLPLPSNRRFREAERRLDQMIYELIARRRAGGNGSDSPDLLAMLLAARDDDGSRMTDKQLRDEVLTLFLAGHETTAINLSWTLYLLAQNPEVEARLSRELREVLGDRAPTPADVPRLAYTNLVLTESMRLYPPAWSVGREAVERFEVGGFAIPAGAQVWMSQWVVQRDPRWFADPDAFRPERWADGLAKRLPKFAYFPFGGGPRLCIGNAFAQMEGALVLATIAQRFALALEPGQRVEPFPSITLRPRYGIKMRLRART